MTHNNQIKNATPEGIVRYAYEREKQAVVYNNFDGHPLKVTFLGERWWVTTPGLALEPLEEYFEGGDIGFVYLCEEGGTVGALELARMLGKCVEEPEDNLTMVLRRRVEDLRRYGVTIDVKDEPLVLELEIVSNEGCSWRQGKFSAKCHVADNYFELLFDTDAFETKKDAEEWVCCYFDYLEEIGIEYTIL